jgi:hypothetical protein
MSSGLYSGDQTGLSGPNKGEMSRLSKNSLNATTMSKTQATTSALNHQSQISNLSNGFNNNSSSNAFNQNIIVEEDDQGSNLKEAPIIRS